MSLRTLGCTSSVCRDQPYSDTRWHEDSVVTAGSAYGGAVCRVNEWFSAYAMGVLTAVCRLSPGIISRN
ncbi:Ail/Lom family outer membrane beta-barrel protein [Escherichia coli]|uniref:Ail/Lom family outer membrane beta-barrel protein n=1 Tax=Escherichia coli TaxID=562 RepID=UPI0008FBCBEC